MTAWQGTALIVGASRGLGLGLAQEYLRRGWRVIATVRAPGSALETLQDQAADALRIEMLDINEPDQIAALRRRLADETLNLLFVNAGVANDPKERIGAVSTDAFMRVVMTNTLSPLRVIEQFASLLAAGGVIAAMSSGLGSVSGNETGGWEVYRASKAGLNTLLRSFALRPENGQRTVLAVAPGWVRTDMGGPGAPLDVETSARGMADAIAARAGRPGVAYVDYRNEDLAW